MTVSDGLRVAFVESFDASRSSPVARVAAPIGKEFLAPSYFEKNAVLIEAVAGRGPAMFGTYALKTPMSSASVVTSDKSGAAA